MKKAGLILLMLFLILSMFLGIKDVNAQTDYGTIDEETGLPREFKKFSEISQNLSEEEQRKEYLKQEWTKLLADKKVVGPVLFYTNKFFVLFNPLWRYTFGMEFEWSWIFIFSLIIWIVLIILVYSPAKGMTNLNPLVALLISIIIASIAGSTGLIKKAVDMLTIAIKTFWIAVIITAVIVIIAVLYSQLMKQWGKQLKEESEKEKTERAQKAIQSAGNVAEKELESYGKK